MVLSGTKIFGRGGGAGEKQVIDEWAALVAQGGGEGS